MFIWVVLITVISTVQSFSISSTSSFKSVWSKLWASYNQLHPNLHSSLNISITPDSAAGVIQLSNGQVTSISSTDIKFITYTAQTLGTKFHSLPLFYQPYSFFTNIPQMGVNQLIFNWDILSEMYLGNINSWNDSRLVELNPLLAKVNKSIIHVLRNTNNSATTYLTTIYSSISTEWNQKYGIVTTWPADLNVPKILTSTNVFATFAEVFANEYTISYGSLPFFNSIGSASGVNPAGFKKSDDEIVYPSDTELIRQSIENTDWDFGDKNVTGLNMNTHWPFILPVYLILPDEENPNINCDELSDNLRFLRWIYTDSRAKKVAESEGYYYAPASQREEIVSYMDTIICKGERLLQVKFIKSPSQEGQWTVTAFFGILVLSSIIMFAVMNFKKAIYKIYAVILVIGELLCGGATIFWAFSPNSDWICIGRWWLMGLGLVIFSGGVFCRSYQLKKIHELVKRGRYQSAKYLDHIKLLVTLMGIIIIIEFIILIALQFIAPFKSELIVIDSLNLEGEYRCTSKTSIIWIILLSVYLFCILILGVYFLYTTWRISSSVDDTRINILMFFGCLVTIIVADVIWGNSSTGDETDTWWALSLIVIWGICMMSSVFIPKLVKAAKRYTSSESSKTDKSTDRTTTNTTDTKNTLNMTVQ